MLKRLLKLPQYLSKTEKIIILALFGVIFITTVWAIFDRFFIKKTIVPDYGGAHIEGEIGEIRSLIPILNQNEVEKDISKLIFSSLIKYNQKREPIGDLTEKWEISPDGKTYTFYLRQANWQDGSKFTADDVVFTFSLIQNEETKSSFFESFKDVEIKKIDEKTVSFGLKIPLAPFLTSLTVPILPKHLLSETPPAKLSSSQFIKKPVGSGPFSLKKIEKNKEATSVILQANKDYFLKKPYLEKFIFKIYPSQEQAEKAFGKKQILGLLEESTKNNGYKIILPQLKVVFFNLASPSLNKNIRKALALATNKNEVIQSVGQAEKIDFPILPGFLGYKESQRWDFDSEKAKIFLSKSPNPPLLNLLVKQGPDEQIAEILKKQWAALGIEVNIEVEVNAHFEKAITEKNYDLLLVGVNQKADPDPYPFWHSSQSSEAGFNFSSFKNSEVDELLEQARQNMDLNFRKQKYERFIDIIQSEVPAIFLYQPIYNYRLSDIIKGMEGIKGVTKSDRFWNVENWYVKTKRVKNKK